MFSREEKSDMLQIYYMCQRYSIMASEQYFQTYPERLQPNKWGALKIIFTKTKFIH